MNENTFYIYEKEKQKYIEEATNESNDFQLEKIGNEFKDKIKRYLGQALKIINRYFKIDYSLNKEAEGMTSQFKKITSIVRKSDAEILKEMDEFMANSSTLGLNKSELQELVDSIEIIMIYCTSFKNGNTSILDKLTKVVGEDQEVQINLDQMYEEKSDNALFTLGYDDFSMTDQIINNSLENADNNIEVGQFDFQFQTGNQVPSNETSNSQISFGVDVNNDAVTSDTTEGASDAGINENYETKGKFF